MGFDTSATVGQNRLADSSKAECPAVGGLKSFQKLTYREGVGLNALNTAHEACIFCLSLFALVFLDIEY